jgi:hypothetical protein
MEIFHQQPGTDGFCESVRGIAGRWSLQTAARRRVIFEKVHSMMSKNKSVKDVARAPVELIKDVGDAMLSISRQESDEQTAALKSEHSKKARNPKATAR